MDPDIVEKVAETPVSEAPIADTSVSDNRSDISTPKDDDTSLKADIARAYQTEEKAARARDESGKFVKAPKVKEPKEPTAAPVEAAPKTESSPPAEAPAPTPPQAVSEAPKAWGKEHHDIWNKLPQEARDLISKREEQISNGFQQYGPVKQVFEKHTPYFQQRGINPAQYVENAIAWDQAFSNPATREAAFQQFAESYGFNPSTSPQSSEQLQQPFDVNALRPIIAPIQQELGQLKSQWENTQRETTAREIQTWAKDKPHFEKVKVRMGQMLQGGAATGLDDAYQQAIWADPAIRGELTKAETEKQIKEQTERAQKAKSAVVSPTTRAPSSAVNGKGNGKDNSVRADIERAMQQLQEDRA